MLVSKTVSALYMSIRLHLLFIIKVLFMINDINWIYYFWKLTSVVTQNYKTKDWKEWKKYELLFKYIWWVHSIWITEDFKDFFKSDTQYALPVGVYTNEKLSFSKLFLRTKENEPIYEILNWELLQLN